MGCGLSDKISEEEISSTAAHDDQVGIPLGGVRQHLFHRLARNLFDLRLITMKATVGGRSSVASDRPAWVVAAAP